MKETAPEKMIREMTRDNFDPGMVLVALRSRHVPDDQAFRLLEEACHAFNREIVRLNRARAVVENLRQDLN